MSTLTTLIEQYLGGPKELREAVGGMTREHLLARPVAGKMSTLEVVCHIADFEPVYAHRMKRVIAEENPTLMGADQDRFRAALAYHERDLEEELGIVDHARSQMARILRTLPEAALQRPGVHSERGPVTLELLLTTITGH